MPPPMSMWLAQINRPSERGLLEMVYATTCDPDYRGQWRFRPRDGAGISGRVTAQQGLARGASPSRPGGPTGVRKPGALPRSSIGRDGFQFVGIGGAGNFDSSFATGCFGKQ